MEHWYDLMDEFDTREYDEKRTADTEDENGNRDKKVIAGKSGRTCSWVKKRNYKNKLRRRFLSINPAMNVKNKKGAQCSAGIYICKPKFIDGKFFDPQTECFFNPHCKIFLSPRGDLRKYHGDVFPIGTSFAIRRKDKNKAKITNRRIRRRNNEEAACSYSYYKKHLGPMVDEMW